MRSLLTSLTYAATLGLGLYVTFKPTLLSGFERMQAERGDGVLNHYILEHSWQSVSNPDYRGSLSSPPCFYPAPYTLWYSEHLLGVAPVYWALRVALPYDLAYQWWQIVVTALNFAAMAAVVRWLRGPHALAVLGGYLWAFALVHIHQLGHQQLIPRFMMPLALYHAWMLVLALVPGGAPSDPLRHLNRMLAAVFVQAITCVNTGWFLVAGLATFLPLAVTLRGGWGGLYRLARERGGRLALILGGWAAALVVVHAPYILINWKLARTYGESTGLVPTPSAWLTAPPGCMWQETTAPYRVEVSDECWLFCGFGIYALAAAASLHVLFSAFRRDRLPELGLIAAGLLTAFAWVALTLTPEHGGPSLWEYVRHIPGGKAIRCVSRVYVLVYLFGTLGALVWLARVTEPLRPAARGAVLVLIAAGCVAEQLGYDPPSFEKADFYPIADRLAGEMSRGDFGYVYPRYTDTKDVTSFGLYGDLLAMWAGLRANVPVVNGYSGRVPDSTYLPFSFLRFQLRQNPVPDVMTWLRERKVRGRLVLLDPDHLDATRVVVIE